MADMWNGQCFCGRVSYRMHGPPMFIHCCHCRDCQRQAGSAFAINGLIEANRIELLGEKPAPVRMATDSGYPHDIYRCTECGSALWSDYGGRTWLRFLRLATLDRPDDFVPDVHIYTRSKLPWVLLPQGVRAFEEYYDVKQEWPAASAARYRMAKEKAGTVL
jgi:hypothetical protein